MSVVVSQQSTTTTQPSEQQELKQEIQQELQGAQEEIDRLILEIETIERSIGEIGLHFQKKGKRRGES